MARHCYSADDAFKNLSRLSQNSHRKLRDIAQSIVDGTRSDQPVNEHASWQMN
jgi:AmiR/NasT family two-component response regulator